MPACTHKSSCKRDGKVAHECVVKGCGHTITACLMHKEAAKRVMRLHVMTAHVEATAALDDFAADPRPDTEAAVLEHVDGAMLHPSDDT